MQNLIHGFGDLITAQSLAYLFGGAVLGMLIGVIPGMSVVVILSLILVFTYHINLTGSLCLFIGAQCGGFYSASVSSILLNTPPHPEALPITFDGYPMARNGNPGRALGLSAASTCIGGFIGCGVLIGFLQVINYFPKFFYPPEYVALVALALFLAGTLGSDSAGKAVVAAGTGILLSSVGPSVITGQPRYTFGANGLDGGISVVALAIGMFAIPQMIMVFGTGTATARQDMTGRELGAVQAVSVTSGYGRALFGGIVESFRHWKMLLQSGIVGGLTGIIPGIGGFTGNFMAYGIARQTSKNRHLFGTGTPEGIIAPEGSSLAKEAGHVIPIIGLGIPGGIAGALFIALFSIKGIRVGFDFQQAHPDVSGEIVWIIALSGLIGTIVGVLIGPQIARVTRIPGPLIVPVIFAVCVSGVFLTDSLFFSVVEILAFAIIGLAFRRLGYPLGSLIIGLVLGPTLETNIYLTRNIYPGVTFLTRRPLADGIALLAILVLVAKVIEHRRELKARRLRLAEELEGVEGDARVAAERDQRLRLSPYPLLALITDAALFGVSIFAIVYAVTRFERVTAILPVVGGICILLPALYFLPRDISRYRFWRLNRTSPIEAGSPVEVRVEESVEFSELVVSEDAAGLSTVSLLRATETFGTEVSVPAVSHESQEKSWGPNGQYRRELIALAWLIGLVVACWLFSFVIGTAIFMVAYGVLSTRRYLRNPVKQMAFTVIAALVMVLVTYEMFHLTGLTFTPRV